MNTTIALIIILLVLATAIVAFRVGVDAAIQAVIRAGRRNLTESECDQMMHLIEKALDE